ncbi:hypothetical protein COOONC_11845 [Cooperia oncophora]
MCRDGCIENVGMSHRSKTRMVLDVLERMGFQLMMTPRSSARDRYQKWTFSPDGRLWCEGLPNMAVTHQAPNIFLSKNEADEDDVMPSSSQVWRIQRQRPGSGTLEVECLHSGPTLVVRITDREDRMRTLSMPVLPKAARPAQAVTFRQGTSYVEKFQQGASVEIDNQLLNSDKWQVLYCQPEVLMPDDDSHSPWANGDLPPGVSGTARPALKLEMNCTPMKHYDAFDCFRVKLCDLDVQLDELLLWKLSGADRSMRTRRWYFGTLDLEMGQIALSVVTVSKSSLPPECRQLKQQFNMKLVSFENAAVYLPPFRQFHYFETSSFLLESLQKFYFAELQKQTLNIVVTLDAFGNPLGLVTDLKDSFQVSRSV